MNAITSTPALETDESGWTARDYEPANISFAQAHGLPYPGEITIDRTPEVLARLEAARHPGSYKAADGILICDKCLWDSFNHNALNVKYGVTSC